MWIGAAALGVALLVLAAVVPEDPPETGPAGSSFSTAGRGAAAYLELLDANGFTTVQSRSPLAGTPPAAGETLVVLDTGGLDDEDAEAVAHFVSAGGRAVVGGRRVATDVAAALGWQMRSATGEVGTAVPLAPVPETAGIATLSAAGPAHWTATGAALPVAGAGERVLAAVGVEGDGRVLLLADAGPFLNDGLALADNARFALNAAGAPGGRVVFAESIHGFAPRRGLAALPARWRWALAGLAGAAAMWVAARARRLGPPQPEVRPLPPPRAGYVDALAATLARTRRPADAAAPVRAEALRLVAARSGLQGAVPPAEVGAAATRLGLPPEEVAGLAEDGAGPAGIVAAGRALARLRGGRDRRMR